jgi:phage terminase Nu1 subunit (DNA packaging protein)
MMFDTDAPLVQSSVAAAVGVSKQAISALLSDGSLPPCATNGDLLLAYCERLREQAAGRMGGEIGGLDLVQERAALARSQRESQDLKNAVARGEFAPVGLLADVLGRAASSVVDRFDLLEGALRKACPDISDEVLLAVLGVNAAARNEWLRATARLVDDYIDQMAGDDEEAEPLPDFGQDDVDGLLEGATL